MEAPLLTDALDAFADIFSPPFRSVMLKSLALTTAFLIAAGIGLDRLGLSLVHVGPGWLQTLISVALALGLVVGLALLAAPVTSLVASFYLDAFFVLNGYLFGREYFELAAMRHMSRADARLLREDRTWECFVAGVIIAAFVAVPLLNLLTPLFATALITRVYKRAAGRR